VWKSAVREGASAIQRNPALLFQIFQRNAFHRGNCLPAHVFVGIVKARFIEACVSQQSENLGVEFDSPNG
jgi:hypothetical protein